MKCAIQKDGMWLVSYVKCGIGILFGGEERFAFTGLYSSDLRDAKIFTKYQHATRVAALLGNAKTIILEGKKDD